MIIVFDIGNTNITIGCYCDNNKWKHLRIKTDREKTYDEYGLLLMDLFDRNNILLSKIEGAIISSVVPKVLFNIEKATIRYLKVNPILVSNDLDLGINIKYDNPNMLSTDRICNAVGAYNLYGGPVIVVDAGTITTICAINEAGDYLGGVIISGIDSMLEIITSKAPNLQKLSLDEPNEVISTNTTEAINSGLIYGYASMIDGLIDRFKKEMNNNNVIVVGTGGLISKVSSKISNINEIYDDLILEGLRIIYERNNIK